MANVNLAGTLVPAVSSEPTHDEQYGKGGYRTVSTIVERDAIPIGLLKTGMVVFVDDGTDLSYQYNGVTWEGYGVGKVNQSAVSGTDVLRYGGSGWVAVGLSVGVGEIGPLAVTAGTIGINAVGSSNIINSAVITDKISDGNVTEVKTASTIGFNYINSELHNAVAPITSTSISLSALTLGATGGIGLFKIENNGAGTVNYSFDNADAASVGTSGTSIFGGGCACASIDAGNTAQVICQIATTEEVFWMGSSAASTVVTLIGYIKFRG